MEEAPKTPMSIEQAGNFLAEKKKTMKEDIKAEAKQNPISVMNPADTRRYLEYGISLLTDVSESHKNSWCMAARKPPALYSTKEVARLLRALMTLRVSGASIEAIAKHLGTTPVAVMQSEKIALRAIGEAINRSQANGVPIIGAL